MPKKYKIKRNYNNRGNTFKARPRPLAFIFMVLVPGGLVFIGISAYGPVAGFISQQFNRAPRQYVPQYPEPYDNVDEPAAEPEPQPEPPPAMPEHINAVSMYHNIAADPAMWEDFVADIAPGFNTVMVEVKNTAGHVLFNTANQNAIEWDAVADDFIDLSALSEFLRENDLYLAVRMSAFLDPLAARADHLNLAVMHQSGVIWLDNAYTPWLSPFSAGARDYLMQLAVETAQMGAIFVMFENYRFPTGFTNFANFGDTGGMSWHQILSSFAGEMEAALDAEDARFAVLMPLWVLDYPDIYRAAMFYGGNPADIAGEIVLELDLGLISEESFSYNANHAAALLPEWVAERQIRILGAITQSETESFEFQRELWADAGIDISEFIIF